MYLRTEVLWHSGVVQKKQYLQLCGNTKNWTDRFSNSSETAKSNWRVMQNIKSMAHCDATQAGE
jgi:hypothetical protein